MITALQKSMYLRCVKLSYCEIFTAYYKGITSCIWGLSFYYPHSAQVLHTRYFFKAAKNFWRHTTQQTL